MSKKPISNGKLQKKAATTSTQVLSTAVERCAGEPYEHHIRERAHAIWIEEGRPHGRDLSHWQRACHELQREAP